MNKNRRSLLIAAPALALGLMSTRQAAAQTKVSEADPAAKALNYKEDASKVDAAKFKNYVKGNDCANCRFYVAKGSVEGSGSLLGGRLVMAKGWCTVWAKKA